MPLREWSHGLTLLGRGNNLTAKWKLSANRMGKWETIPGSPHYVICMSLKSSQDFLSLPDFPRIVPRSGLSHSKFQSAGDSCRQFLEPRHLRCEPNIARGCQWYLFHWGTLSHSDHSDSQDLHVPTSASQPHIRAVKGLSMAGYAGPVYCLYTPQHIATKKPGRPIFREHDECNKHTLRLVR